MLNKKIVFSDIPTYSICNLHDNDTDDVVVVSLKPYLLSARSVVFPHRHSFYQVIYNPRRRAAHY